MGSIPNVRIENIPQELRERPQWVLWRYEERLDTRTKVPMQPGGRKRADVSKPATWATFERVVEELHSPRRFDGLGYVFAKDDPYFGADLDDIDPDGELAARFVEGFGTYAERSPSGRGVHFIGRGEVPTAAKEPDGELYVSNRFFTVTGDVLGDANTITDAQDAAMEFYRWLRRNRPETNGSGDKARGLRPGLAPSPQMDDDEVLGRARRAKNGDEFERVYSGGGAFKSPSERDLRLASLIAFFSQDREQVARIMRASGCAREKYARDDYLRRTIDKALAELEATYSRSSEQAEEPVEEPVEAKPRPQIVAVARDTKQVLAECADALVAANEPPTMFVRGGLLSMIARDEDGAAGIRTASVDALRGRLAHAARFVRLTRKGEPVPTPPPKEIAQMLHAGGEWPGVPPLVGLSCVPVLRPDGTVHDAPGYDAGSRIFYDAGPEPRDGLPPKVPREPTRSDVRTAQERLEELLQDFPFASDTDRANAWGMLLTPVARPWIAGPVPLALIDKPKMGSGASLLAAAVATIATGYAPFLGAPSSDEEWTKVITSALLAGQNVLIFDNITERIDSAALSRALTSPTWADRLLGTNTVAHLPQRATWIATGNNIAVGGDVPRRCYRIRLDPKVSKPWQREGFAIPDLLRWAQENRGELVASLLTLCVDWHRAGRPPAGEDRPRIGGFEGWDRTVSGILARAGVEGFLRNLDEFYEAADEDGAEWAAFLATWHECVGPHAITLADLVSRFSTIGGREIRAALPADLAETFEHNERGFTRRLGRALAKRNGARYGDEGYFASEAGEHNRAKKWLVGKDADTG